MDSSPSHHPNSDDHIRSRGLNKPDGIIANNEASSVEISNSESVFAVISNNTAGAQVWAYGTVIDNSSGDPTALQMTIVK